MKLPHRRHVLRLAAGAAALPVISRVAWAQAYPSRPVRLVVGFPAGGTTDIAARLIAQWLTDRLGQPFVVENRPGASTNIAVELVVRSPADGYTLYAATSTNAVNATFFDRLNFNFVRDLAMVGGIVRSPLVLEVNPAVPFNTVPALVAYAKANPGKISLASFGVGSTSHVAGELFKMMAGVNMTHVPYRGSTPLVTDLLGGQVQAAFDNLPASIEHIRAGRLRALAVSTAARAEQLPNVPALGEFLPGFEASAWVGVGGAEEHARRGDRAAQPGDQRGPCRSENQGAADRSRWRGVCRVAGGVCQARHRRNREMGQGDPRRQHQAGVIRQAQVTFHNVSFREPDCDVRYGSKTGNTRCEQMLSASPRETGHRWVRLACSLCESGHPPHALGTSDQCPGWTLTPQPSCLASWSVASFS